LTAIVAKIFKKCCLKQKKIALQKAGDLSIKMSRPNRKKAKENIKYFFLV
jgi:hypothetical protein